MRLPIPLPLILAVPWLAFTMAASAADIYVSTTGFNGQAGTIDQPHRNIDYAADRAKPGDTIFVRAGEYRERLSPSKSGTSSNRIRIKNYPGESPIIDGTGQSVGGQTAMVDIGNESYITLDGFQIRNLITGTDSRTPIGILVDGASVGIEILNCELYNIRNNGGNGNAHGILVQGTSAVPISDLVIRGNEIRDLILGNSEALVLNGNVNGFEVSKNFVHDCNNLGIDFIGFEGNGPAGQDQARNGICADNVVTNISTLNNPAYNEYSAGGIYVDGGRDIIIERNRVSLCDIGIEVASEDRNGSTSNITVRDNLIWRNNIGGIFVGGYNSSRGSADDCEIVRNTLFENDTAGEYNGEILVQYNTSNLDVSHNILMAGAEKVPVIVNNGNNSNLTFDYNVYYSRFATSQGSSEWVWNGSSRGSFNDWKSTSGQDSNSLYVNPRLTDATAFEFTIAADSPARDHGDVSYIPIDGETDAFGNPRLSGNRIDAGAHEFVFLSELQQWRQLHFGTSSNSGDAANDADPDSDGLVNLTEFALAGQDPNSPLLGELLTSTAAGLEFTRNPDAADEVNYQISASSDLANWSLVANRSAGSDWSNSAATTLSESSGKSIFSDSRQGRGSRHYYRLNITIP